MPTHNTHNRQTLMPPAGLKSVVPASYRSQTHALDCPSAGIAYTFNQNLILWISHAVVFWLNRLSEMKTGCQESTVWNLRKSIQNVAYCLVTPCILVGGYQHFETTCCFCHQGQSTCNHLRPMMSYARKWNVNCLLSKIFSIFLVS